MEGIGVLSPVDIRKVWPDEAKDFTPWLAENADLLGEALGMDVVHEQTEAGVGRYSADLVFREESTSRLITHVSPRVAVRGSLVRGPSKPTSVTAFTASDTARGDSTIE